MLQSQKVFPLVSSAWAARALLSLGVVMALSSPVLANTPESAEPASEAAPPDAESGTDAAEAKPSPQDRAARACGADAVCLALLAKNFADCKAFQTEVARGWYPAWATGQTGLCAVTQGGTVLYGFTGATDKGVFEFFAMSATGIVCRGLGHRSVRAAQDRTNLDGAASFSCSNGAVGVAAFGADDKAPGRVVGNGVFFKGPRFKMTAFDMRGMAPSLFAGQTQPRASRPEPSRTTPGSNDRIIAH
ncbi:MAG: hypothetical protein AAFV62_05755 [Pseudomonadota bacterium]